MKGHEAVSERAGMLVLCEIPNQLLVLLRKCRRLTSVAHTRRVYYGEVRPMGSSFNKTFI